MSHVEHQVVELEVAVDDCGTLRIRREHGGEPVRQAIHLLNLARLRSLPALRPSADLPLHEACGFAQVQEPRTNQIDGMQIGERIHERTADGVADRGRIADG